MKTRPPPPRGIAPIALGVFLLAVAVRLVWLFKVQSPLDAVYSDMGGYVDRAQLLLANKTPADPRVMTMYPPGAHSLIALEFLALGRESRRAIGIAHAIIGAIPAPCLTFLTVDLIPSRLAAALVGTLVALWYPQACFTAYFSSEMWFSAAVALHACLTVRHWKRPPGQLATGVAGAVAFVVRPQFILAWMMDLGARLFAVTWRRGPVAAVRSVVWLVLPVALTMAGTSARFHKLTGRWGLISESALNRVWADTDICQVKATWKTPNGETWSYWFSPPSKPAHKPVNEVQFDGYILDSKILDRIRHERMRGVPWYKQLQRRYENVKLLVTGNLPWPESNYRDPWRAQLQQVFADTLLIVVLPLAALGLALGPWNRTMRILAANIATVIIAAAYFYGEARYNIPYAPFALLLAVTGVYELFRRGLRLARGVRERRALA
jgi:hypothetical protein